MPRSRDRRRLRWVGREWCSLSAGTGVDCAALLAAGGIACTAPGSCHGAVAGPRSRAGPGVGCCFVAPTAPAARQATGWRIEWAVRLVSRLEICFGFGSLSSLESCEPGLEVLGYYRWPDRWDTDAGQSYCEYQGCWLIAIDSSWPAVARSGTLSWQVEKVSGLCAHSYESHYWHSDRHVRAVCPLQEP